MPAGQGASFIPLADLTQTAFGGSRCRMRQDPQTPLQEPAPFTRAQGILCFVLAAGLDVALGLRSLPAVLAGRLINPDSTMRLLRIQESLAQGALVHAVPRDGSGAGTVLHWSHFLDVILLAMAAPVAAIAGWEAGLRVSFLLLGPISAGLLGVALAWAAAPVSRPEFRWLAAVVAGTATPIVGYAIPGVVHHHIPVAVTVVLTLGFAGRGLSAGARAGAWMGLMAALGILLTPESMPFTLMGFGLLGLSWLLRAENAPAGLAARAAGLVFFAVVALALAIDPPLAGYGAAEVDRLSTVWLGLAAACAAAGSVLAALAGRTGRAPRALGLAAGLVALVLWLAVFPQVLGGPRGLLPPELSEPFFKDIQEMQPVRQLGDGLVFVAAGAFGAVALAVIAWQRRRLEWGYAALCGLVVVGLAVAHIRFSTYAAMLGAAMLPVALSAVTTALAARPEGLRAATRLMLIGLFLLLPPAGSWLTPAGTAEAAPSCEVALAVPLLAPLGDAIVLANPNETPELLLRTRVRTVGSLYHRNAAAFVRLRAAWRAIPGQSLPDAVRATGASYMLVCPGKRRSALISDLPGGTLLDALSDGQTPPWAERVAASDASGHVLYRIKP